jgi:uncharacterized protein (DUF1778 family)
MATTSATPPGRSARLVLRATPEQQAILLRAAEVARKSLSEFILDSAFLAAEQTLLDQRLFVVPEDRYLAFTELLERTEPSNAGLAELLARRAPWETP